MSLFPKARKLLKKKLFFNSARNVIGRYRITRSQNCPANDLSFICYLYRSSSRLMFSLFKISLLKRSWFLSAPYLLKQTLHSKVFMHGRQTRKKKQKISRKTILNRTLRDQKPTIFIVLRYSSVTNSTTISVCCQGKKLTI